MAVSSVSPSILVDEALEFLEKLFDLRVVLP